MEKLNLSIADYPDIPNSRIVYFEGDFDGYAEETIATIQGAVDQAVAGGVLIFDFSKLNYLNSFAIGQLVGWFNAMTAKQGKILIVGINKNIEDIFSVLGISNIFKTYADLDALKQGEGV